MINIDESAAKIAAQLENNPTPVASTSQEPIQAKNLDGTPSDDEAKAKEAEAEVARVSAEAEKASQIEANNQAAIEAKAAEDAVKKDAAIKDADLEEFEPLSDEDLAYLKEIEGVKEEKVEGKVEEKREPKKVKEVSEDYAPLKEKASEYEKILSDPILKAVIDFRKNGGKDIEYLD